MNKNAAVLILVCAMAPLPVLAQSATYRSVMPDGKIIYGDKPAPGAKESKKLNLAPLNISTPQPAPDNSAAAEKATANATRDAQIAEAKQKLDAAKRALEAGREIREGDRIGLAKGSGGTSRPSEQYTDRVKQLEDAVANAQRELDDLQRDVR